MMCAIALLIGAAVAFAGLTVYVRYNNTKKIVTGAPCKLCKQKNTVLRGFTPFMVEHYCPSCKCTFFTER